MEIAIIGGGIAGLALPAARVVHASRTAPPDFINIRIEELTGDRPFGNLDDFISREELCALSDRYKRIAGYSIEQLGNRIPHPPREICGRERRLVSNLRAIGLGDRAVDGSGQGFVELLSGIPVVLHRE